MAEAGNQFLREGAQTIGREIKKVAKVGEAVKCIEKYSYNSHKEY